MAAFGKDWNPTKVKDVVKESLFSKIYHACKEWKEWTGRENFLQRMDFVRRMLFLTIEQGWRGGLGPCDKPYWMCAEEELEFEYSSRVAPF